jgi:hypothetical protein
MPRRGNSVLWGYRPVPLCRRKEKTVYIGLGTVVVIIVVVAVVMMLRRG